jgi:hypothetical protein
VLKGDEDHPFPHRIEQPCPQAGKTKHHKMI